jgi:hypothetical protein
MITSWCCVDSVEGCSFAFPDVIWEISHPESTGEFHCCRVPAWLR